MPQDISAYADGIRSLNEAENLVLQQRLHTARQEAERLGSLLLQEDPTLHAVWLFGSVARGDARSLTFDIDLALDGGDLYKALDYIDDSPFSVDLVALHLLPEAMRLAIRRDGIRLAALPAAPTSPR